ncbi:hypothetical protein H311_00089 [Anncaliia algerae PRA109]|nr:hypothetical protein H311_00089 [Anncaliia algerae PRA109]
MNFFELMEITKDEINVINFLIQKNVLKSNIPCFKCGKIMILEKSNKNINKYMWVCQKRTGVNQHRLKRGITVDSFFENSKLNLKTLTSLYFFWDMKSQLKQLYHGLKYQKIL